MFKKRFWGLFLIIFFILSCNLIHDKNRFKDQALSGEILGIPFIAGIGGKLSHYNYDISKMDIIFYSLNEESIFPVLNFPLEKDSEPKVYTISNSNKNDIELVGHSSLLEYVFFDEGEIEILSITDTEISGRLWAKTKEGTSSVNGNFLVILQ